jgi:hypothetical protein
MKFEGQADFVNIIENRVAYKNLSFKRVNATRFQVFADDGVKNVTYDFIKDVNDDFMKINDAFFGDVLPILYQLSDTPVYTGTGWVTATANNYTTVVGDTFTVHCSGTELRLSTFKDNRGGIWEIVVDGDTTNKVTISTYSATSLSGAVETVIKTGLSFGSHTIVGTFKGADPNNPPSGGTARGWLYNSSTDTKNHTVDGYIIGNAKTASLLNNGSNKEMAIQISVNGGTAYVIPDHGTGVAFYAEPIKILLDNTQLDLSSMADNDIKSVNAHVNIIQHCYAQIPNVTGNVAEFWITHHIDKRGKVSYSGVFKALQGFNVIFHYPLMLPMDVSTTGTILTAIGNKKVSAGDESTYFFAEEQDKTYSVACVSATNKDYIAAGKINFPLKSYRIGQPNIPAKGERLFLWQRATAPKVYFSSAYNLPMVANDMLSWNGEIIIANIPNIYNYVAS